MDQNLDPIVKTAGCALKPRKMHPRKVDRSILEGKSIVLFRATIKSPQTLDPYERRLCNFLYHTKMTCDQFVNLARKNPKKAEEILISYAIKDKEKLYEKEESKKLSACTIVNRIKPVKLLLDINDVDKVKWKKIKRFLPAQRRFAVDRTPTMDEIRRICEVCDLRGKAMFLLLLSSGIREGAIENLSIKHLQPIEKDGKVVAARLVVYPGDVEEYLTFVTAEAYGAVQRYIDFRRNAGETITQESPLVRDTFSTQKYKTRPARTNSPIRCKPPMVRHYFNNLLLRYGIRTGKRKRHEFSVHSFRKWFKTRAEYGMKSLNCEILMGHSVGLAENYYRVSERELLEDYLHAIPYLTVSETEEVRYQMTEREKTLEEKLAQMEARLTSLLPLALAATQAAQLQTPRDQDRSLNTS